MWQQMAQLAETEAAGKIGGDTNPPKWKATL